MIYHWRIIRFTPMLSTQQQTRRPPLLLSIDGTDRRTPDRYIDPAPHTTWAASITNQYITYTRQFIFLFIVLFFLNVRTFKRVNAYWVTQECCRWQRPWVCPMACVLPMAQPWPTSRPVGEVGVASCRHVRLFRPLSVVDSACRFLLVWARTVALKRIFCLRRFVHLSESIDGRVVSAEKRQSKLFWLTECEN